MRLSKLIGQRIKEVPRDAKTPSHIFLIRGGYVRPVSTGIYTLLPLAKRVISKIENIIREEMNKVDGQEILMPVVLPQELWDESGRSQSVGLELLRFKDRNDKSMLLAMTHEEAVVHMARTEIKSYKQMPAMVYQIQTKYRDEARARAGLIRVREFTMKDAYSFHTSQECLDKYYQRVHTAYQRIFKRVGLNNCISILSDSGMMGGAVSHEFMAVADCGEDTLFISPDQTYKANREIAVSNLNYPQEELQPLKKVHTPNKKTIAEVAEYLNTDPSHTGKTVFYTIPDGTIILVAIRGDIEVNEAKLKKYLQCTELTFASDEQISSVGSVSGYASILELTPNKKLRIILDHSFTKSANLIIGANQKDYHYKNFNYQRDCKIEAEITDLATVRNGDPCPMTGEPLQEKRGIEVGNIFQLGTKYTKTMNCNFLDTNGKTQAMIMGCYGIGIGRTMASVIEQSHDKYGPIWPISIAPYQLHICALNPKKENIAQLANEVYEQLLAEGVEVLYDDRGEKAGFTFNDADLIGIPLRIVFSPRNIKEGQVEFKTRDGSKKEMVSLEQIVPFILEQIKTIKENQ